MAHEDVAAIRRGVFKSVLDLQDAITRYIRDHNKATKPFAWAQPADRILSKLAKFLHLASESVHYEGRAALNWSAIMEQRPQTEGFLIGEHGREDVKRYRSRSHNTYVAENGALRIEEVKGQCIMNKPGADGATIELSEPSPTPKGP